jgi:hypothetical protein
MDYRIASAICALLLAGALSFAQHAESAARTATALFLLVLYLLSTPLVLLAAFLFAALSGTLVVFAAFHLNYVFQKRLVESATDAEDGGE